MSKAGRYDVWLAGSFASDADVTIDGKHVGQVTGLANQGDYAPAGTVTLEPGAHVAEVHYPRRALSPGTGVPLAEIGPLALAPVATATRGCRRCRPRAARARCAAVRLDWIEVAGPAASPAEAG